VRRRRRTGDLSLKLLVPARLVNNLFGMAAFHFVDRSGQAWMVLPGLPIDHPAAAAEEPLPGLTFRAANGELRVLVRASMRRQPSSGIVVPPFGVGPRALPPAAPDWESLLSQATTWPA
jgi:hypothetical protein